MNLLFRRDLHHVSEPIISQLTAQLEYKYDERCKGPSTVVLRYSPSMALHLNPPCRAEHIGSLLRPQTLVAKRFEYEAQKCSHEELQVVENDSIPAVVKLQQQVGIKSITDGEMRRCDSSEFIRLYHSCPPRGAFYQGMFETLGGMTVVPACKGYENPWKYHLTLTPRFSIHLQGKSRRDEGYTLHSMLPYVSSVSHIFPTWLSST